MRERWYDGHHAMMLTTNEGVMMTASGNAMRV